MKTPLAESIGKQGTLDSAHYATLFKTKLICEDDHRILIFEQVFIFEFYFQVT